jgi:hypothetical protein
MKAMPCELRTAGGGDSVRNRWKIFNYGNALPIARYAPGGFGENNVLR